MRSPSDPCNAADSRPVGSAASRAVAGHQIRRWRTPQAVPAPYWFFFYSFDCTEPTHVHVRRDRQHCKFWLAPVELAWNHGVSPRELNEVRHMVLEYEQVIIEAWNEHCGQR